MTEREIYERIVQDCGCRAISCFGSKKSRFGINDIPCPLKDTNCFNSDKIAQAWLDAHKENKMEQKYGKVIFDPRTEEAKALVGKEVEGANCFNFEHNVTHGKLIMNDGSMTMPDVFPFIIGGYKFTFIRAIEPPKEPSYRPFTDEEMIALYGKTLVDKNGLPHMVTGFVRYQCGLFAHVGGGMLPAGTLFNILTLDGHKCGVLV